MAILSILLTTIIIIVSVLLILVVLVQRPKQEGLGAAFGGGAFDSALGAHTTDVLQKITTYLAVAFFISAIGLAMVKSKEFAAASGEKVFEKIEESKQPPIPDPATFVPSPDGGLTAPEDGKGVDPASKGGFQIPGLDTPAPDAPVPAPAPSVEGGKAAPAPAPTEPAGKGADKGGK